MSTALAALLGAGVGAGIAMLLFAVVGAHTHPAPPRRPEARLGSSAPVAACSPVLGSVLPSAC
jgi:hypothetical protein